MFPTECSTGGASEHQMIMRDTNLLQQLVQALPAGQDINFRAIHEVATRIMQAAYDGWKRKPSSRGSHPHDTLHRRNGGGHCQVVDLAS